MRFSTKTALCLVLTLTVAKTSAASELMGQVEFLGQEVLLYDDGSWKPANEKVSFFDSVPLKNGSCFGLKDETVRICKAPDGLGVGEVYSDEDFTSFNFLNEMTNVDFSIYDNYGHDGDIEAMAGSYEEDEGQWLTWLTYKLMGVELPNEDTRTQVYEDILIAEWEVDSSDPSLGYNREYMLDIYTPTQNFEASVMTTGEISDGEDGAIKEYNMRKQYLLDEIEVRGKPLSDILKDKE